MINSNSQEDVKAKETAPDPQWILRLVDLIFLAQEEGRTVPS